MQGLVVAGIVGGLALQGVTSSPAAQSNAVPLSVALRTLTAHAFDGFAEDRGKRTSQKNGVSVYDMAFPIDGLSECQIRVRRTYGSGADPSDVATCKDSGADPLLAANAFASLLGQLRQFVGQGPYIRVASTTEGSSKLTQAEFATADKTLITIDMTERSDGFEIIVSVRPIFDL